MFIQNKGHVTMTIELQDTEEAQTDDPLDIQVNGLDKFLKHNLKACDWSNKIMPFMLFQCLSSYMEQFVGTESSLCSQADGYFFKPVFLPR